MNVERFKKEVIDEINEEQQEELKGQVRNIVSEITGRTAEVQMHLARIAALKKELKELNEPEQINLSLLD